MESVKDDDGKAQGEEKIGEGDSKLWTEDEVSCSFAGLMRLGCGLRWVTLFCHFFNI